MKSTEVETAPGQAEFKQGQDLAAAGKYAEAIEAYKKSLKLAKNEAGTYAAMGVAYRMLNRYDDAILAFTEAIRLEPEGAELICAVAFAGFKNRNLVLPLSISTTPPASTLPILAPDLERYDARAAR